jgi:hypothetical protein
MKRRLAGALLALPLLLALALAGCGGSGEDDDGIATAGGDATEEPDSGEGAEELTEEEMYEAHLAYAQCMREHGIEMEDPAPGEPLRIQIQGDPAAAEAAQEACRDLLPEGGPGGGENDAEAREQMLALAECMRENGVESFPDPQPGEGIRIGPEQAEDPDFEAAQEKCNEEVMGGQPDTFRGGGDA